MSPRTFQFRLHSDHGDPETSAGPPLLERLSDSGVWEEQQPGLTTPPFRLSLIALLLCLRFHLVSEAAERQIPLRQLRATLSVAVSETWDLEAYRAEFQLQLDPTAGAAGLARADRAALAALRERMARSPVARNLTASIDAQIIVELAG
jgi:uncharacterized OsmC-like protein